MKVCDGSPIAPLCLDLRAKGGTYSTRAERRIESASPLDGLAPMMTHLEGLELGKTPVFIIDREADSVGHYRTWDAAGRRFVVRADDNRLVLHDGQERRLERVADSLQRRHEFARARTVLFRSKPRVQFVAETAVVLHRPARTHRVDAQTGKVAARWLLLTNLPGLVDPATAALWYYWRWRIESYHKLLKGAGQQIESWGQETAEALLRRLLVAAMSAVIVWRLARENSPQAEQVRNVLVRLSGRQLKRNKNARPFTEPALLAGLGVLVAMLDLLQRYSIDELRRLVQATLPDLLSPPRPNLPRCDDG